MQIGSGCGTARLSSIRWQAEFRRAHHAYPLCRSQRSIGRGAMRQGGRESTPRSQLAAYAREAQVRNVLHTRAHRPKQARRAPSEHQVGTRVDVMNLRELGAIGRGARTATSIRAARHHQASRRMPTRHVRVCAALRRARVCAISPRRSDAITLSETRDHPCRVGFSQKGHASSLTWQGGAPLRQLNRGHFARAETSGARKVDALFVAARQSHWLEVRQRVVKGKNPLVSARKHIASRT
eukprot:scaffold201055_cov29-Tisochrysis_lutea.AAC.5